jgi:hypothetical protein
LRGSEHDASAMRQNGLVPSASNHRKERV